MVCLAACFALSVETKLLTKSLRLPLTSGGGIKSTLVLGMLLLMKEGLVSVAVGLDNGDTFWG